MSYVSNPLTCLQNTTIQHYSQVLGRRISLAISRWMYKACLGEIPGTLYVLSLSYPSANHPSYAADSYRSTSLEVFFPVISREENVHPAHTSLHDMMRKIRNNHSRDSCHGMGVSILNLPFVNCSILSPEFPSS